MSEGMDYNTYVLGIVATYIIVLALVGYVIGSLLLRRRVKSVSVGVGSLVYCAFALLYIAWNSDKPWHTAPYVNPVLGYSYFVALWSLFMIPFMILTYTIGKYRFRHRQGLTGKADKKPGEILS